ncbi:hypothetical protein [Frigidibacter sp. ROC022]|uniref:hypothetical protein n=1 Tax=Frigidibacter sp. ROC022 TaxID=2971796 RepID=UPI00215B3313|nr:hypothetical protein [Frigidibacter sp. ROC022]MCR8725284.1 hypothetical protein [Frigidibacter sp. ROC022]
MTLSRACLTATIVSGLLLALLLAQGVLRLDAVFLPDDTYYALSIARNIAHGLPASTDGVEWTSGFQPLIVLMQVPLFWIWDGGWAPVMASAVLSSVFGLAAVCLLTRLVGEVSGAPWAALAAGLIGATAQLLLLNAPNGLETTLAAATGLWAALLAQRLRRDDPPGRFLALGLVLGLALWARIDTCFIVAAIGLWCLFRFRWRQVLTIALAGLIVVAPWWGYCLWVAGTPVPESGAAVREIAAFYAPHGFDTPLLLGMALLELTTYRGPVPETALVPDLSMLFAAAAFWHLTAALARRRMDAVALLLLAAVPLYLFYGALLPAYWFFERYLLPVSLALIAAMGCMLADIGRRASWLAAPLAAALIMGNLTAAWPLWQAARAEVPEPHGRGYGTALSGMTDILPDGAVVAAMQSGAIGYFARPGVRVINLDGVVSGRAAAAMREHRLAAYLVERGATHFADWSVNEKVLRAHAGIDLPADALTEIARMPPQGTSVVTVFELDLP